MKTESKYIDTPLLRICYEESGRPDGLPVILLHGFPYDVRAFDDARDLLADGPYRLLAPYLRGYGDTQFLSGDTLRSGEQSALAADLLDFMDALNIPRAILAGFDWGGRAACIVSALYPERVIGLVTCGVGYNMHDARTWQQPIAPAAEERSWYVYYFNTERGQQALLRNYTDLCRYLWQLWSPDWRFTEKTYLRSAASFANPDFAAVVAHSYRCRIGEVPEDPHYAHIARRLVDKPAISVPTWVLLGGSDGVTPAPAVDADRARFTGTYVRRVLPHIGHDLPQEAPGALAQAIAEAASAEGSAHA